MNIPLIPSQLLLTITNSPSQRLLTPPPTPTPPPSQAGYRTPAYILRIAHKLWSSFIYQDLQSVLSMEKSDMYPGMRLRYTEWEQQEDLEIMAPLALSVARVLEVSHSHLYFVLST